jgi:hypothetical protein
MRPLRLSLLALAALAASCSLLVDPSSPEQCSSDRDCATTAALRERVCHEGFCVLSTPSFSPEAGEPCVSTALCTQANTGQPSVCRAGRPCTPWQTKECPYVTGAWDDPNAVVIGHIAPFTVKQTDGRAQVVPYAHRVRRAIDLALADFSTEQPGGFYFPGAQPRPFAVVHCDSALDAATALVAFDHLTAIGAQAIIVGADEDLETLTPNLTAAQTAVACSDCVGPLPAGPLVWRVSPPLADEAPMLAWWVEQLEAAIKAGPTPPALVKVALLAEPERAKDQLVAKVSAMLRFNGKSVSENGPGAFLPITTADARRQAIDYQTYIDALTAMAPEIVIVAMGADFPEFYLQGIENQWPAGKPRPHYVLTTTNYEVAPFKSRLGDDDLRRRTSGVRSATSAANEANVEAFSRRYVQSTNGELADGNYSGYEAFYATAYAVLATRTQPLVDGPHIAAGFGRLAAGETIIDLVPERIGFAAALLGNPSATVNLRGLWSDLDWDAARDFHPDVGMYCFERDGNGSLVLKANAGPVRAATTGVVSGSYACD